ncbi:conserved hypothetical protein [Methylocella tundrae]|uniref:Uncharacterized protein n=1 Tax=Methylocella tundrae TaxID=227605 RepID=A0A8B6M098_METTU|nr:hypothetical protein [Methylocella tundrae]VTZ20940.1 conserved hypothetical protein [Methylocella tundrae]VTZ48457.1 conserved hypothetical protein [Methylocella tundrae]
MSIADHFDPRPDAGFVRRYDLQAARRQLRVSIILILVMAGAAIALGLVARLEAPDPQGRPVALRDGGLRLAETLLDLQGCSHQMTT